MINNPKDGWCDFDLESLNYTKHLLNQKLNLLKRK